jgi:hypothetical protein
MTNRQPIPTDDLLVAVAKVRGNSRTDWFFAFHDAFPTPASIMALPKKPFIEAAWDVVGRNVSNTNRPKS